MDALSGELLAVIFGFVAHDEHTIVTCVPLVCRRWRSVCKEHVTLPIVDAARHGR